MSDGSAPGTVQAPPLADRELSWLAFNARVLQEAADATVPLFERLAFLAIFSSNLDEFFRVRVANLRSLLRLKRKRVRHLPVDPVVLLREIHDEVDRQQERFGEIFRDGILPELAARGVMLATESELDDNDRERLLEHFRTTIRPHVEPIHLAGAGTTPFLEDRTVYLAVELHPESSIPVAPGPAELVMVPVPSPPLERFYVLPEPSGCHTVVFLDDIVRLGLPLLFPGRRVAGAWAVKLSRDAELYLEDEFQGDVVEAIRRSLRKRETGLPARFLYDPSTPVWVLDRLRAELALEPEDLVPGARYHNLHDLRTFPRCGIKGEEYHAWEPVPHPELEVDRPVRELVAEGDRLLHFPYHSYDHVVRFLTEAAGDPDVEEIWLTVYRVSRQSSVLNALLEAAEQGKTVRVFVEVKARFDEAANLEWAERLEEAGIVTLYSFPDLKVHAKLALVVRREDGERRRYAYVGTGNFHEETARQYTDFALLTAASDITVEIERVFHFLAGHETAAAFEHLLVAPFGMRERLEELLEKERAAARSGGRGAVTFKLNALEDEEMVRRLYACAADGVELRGVVRGICRMIPDSEEAAGNVHLRSVVDRYLEHGRIYAFHAGGDPEVYIGSADWMHRNLSRRVEVAVPVREPRLCSQLLHYVDLQLGDNRKARLLDAAALNTYAGGEGPPLRSQQAIRQWLAEMASSSTRGDP